MVVSHAVQFLREASFINVMLQGTIHDDDF